MLIKNSVRFVLLFVGGLMSYLRYLCSFTNNGGQHTCVVGFFLSSFCVLLPVSMACPFFIAPSVFYDIYSHTKTTKTTINSHNIST